MLFPAKVLNLSTNILVLLVNPRAVVKTPQINSSSLALPSQWESKSLYEFVVTW